MAYNKANVLVGAATLLIDGANPGWTSGGVSIEHTAEFYNVEVDQETNPVKNFRTKESFKVKFSMAENTIENLKIALGISAPIDMLTAPGYKKVLLGADTSEPVEHSLDIYGMAPGTPARQRRVHFYRVVAVEFGPLAIEKNKEQVIPVTFEAFYDSDNLSVGYIQDQTAREYKNLVCKVTVA